MFLRTFALTTFATLVFTPPPGLGSPPAQGLSAATFEPTAFTELIEVSGRVTVSSTGQPLVGAQVYVTGTNLGTLSAADGRFVLLLDDALTGRAVTVEAAYVGYTTVRHTITLNASAHTLDFALEPVVLELESLVVTGTAGQARRRDGAAQAALLAPRALLRVYNDHVADRESYAYISENDFVAVANRPLSTISIDVDRASYSNVRRFIMSGVRPPIDAVRIEELINYFPYSDPAPDVGNEHPISITVEVAPAPWQPLHHLVRIGLRAVDIDMTDAPANNLVFLLDVSGSMAQPNKLPLLKTALAMLIDQLRPQDRVAIVVYAGAAGLVLPSTPGNERETILGALDALSAGGSTAGGAGISLAYAVAAENFIEGGNNRVILATDGDFNVGASSDSEMVRLIEEKRDEGTFLTVLGFGTGNLQDAKMEQIADHGNGNFAYIDTPLEARKVLVTEMGGTLLTIAKDVKIQVEFNPTRVAAYRLIGYENRLLSDEDFNDDTKDAGELGAGHSVTALYEVIPVGVESPVEVRDVDPLRYQRDASRAVGDNEEILFVKVRYKDPTGSESRLLERRVGDTVVDTSDDFRFAAAVAAWGMLLRESEHCADFTLNDVSRMARGALGDDPHGYRADFVALVDRARSIELMSLEPGDSR